MRIWRLVAAVGGAAILAACGLGTSWGRLTSEEPSAAAAAGPAEPARTEKAGSIKRVYIMTDLEGVAGVRDSEQWCGPDGRYYDLARKLLTLEVNAAISGFSAGGAREIVVCDGHGRGAVDVELLDPRAQLERGWPEGWPGPSLAAGKFDAVAWVGQHAKAGTPYAHLAHTQSWNYVDLSINKVSIGELGQLALCANELGVRAIFASGDKAFSEEARALVPGIETVSVKRGTTPGRGDDLTADQYGRRNTAAVHLHPVIARTLIRTGAERAIRRAQTETFGGIDVKRPLERVARFRPSQAGQPLLVSRESHPSSVIALMNLPFNPKPEAK